MSGPGTILVLVDPAADRPAEVLATIEDARREIERGNPVWIDLENPSETQIEEVRRVFPFHPLAIEDVHHAAQRPKVEEYEKHIFVVAFCVRPGEGSEIVPLELNAFLGEGYLVTFHEEPIPALSDVIERCCRGRFDFEPGADRVLYAVLDGMVDSFFPLLDRLDDEIEAIEASLLESGQGDLLAKIFSVRKNLLEFRKLVQPQREVLSHLAAREYPWIAPSVRTYLRDIQDHLWRIGETADTYREILDTAVETYLSQAAERTNQIIKLLAVIATMGLPITFITGFFGMNFAHMPGIDHPVAVPTLIAAIIALEVALVVVFRKKGWL